MATDGRRWPFYVLTVVVIIAGAAVGGYYGAPAYVLYLPFADMSDPFMHLAGFLLGAFGGAGTGLFWSLAMRRLAGQAGRGILFCIGCIGIGGGLGILAGVLATVFLHAGLVLLTGQWLGITNALTCQIFGVPAGLVTGIFCGFLAWIAAVLSRRRPAAGTPAGEA